MGKLSKEEADQLAALRAKEEAPDEEPDDAGDDEGHVIVLRGPRADSFLESLLGPTKPARKATVKVTKPATGEEAPADDTEDQGAGEDAPPPKANRYFK
jgi:hypothetical protein